MQNKISLRNQKTKHLIFILFSLNLNKVIEFRNLYNFLLL